MRADCCIARTVTIWWRSETKAEIAMCGHHSRQHGPALTAAGYIEIPVLGAEADQPAEKVPA